MVRDSGASGKALPLAEFASANHTSAEMQPIELKPLGSFSPAIVPRHVVQQRFRTPKKNIPQTPEERTQILHAVRNYVAEFAPTPPLPRAR